MNKTNAELGKRLSSLNKTNVKVEVEKQMSWLNERNIEIEKRRSYIKTTNKLNFDRKNAPYISTCMSKCKTVAAMGPFCPSVPENVISYDLALKVMLKRIVKQGKSTPYLNFLPWLLF